MVCGLLGYRRAFILLPDNVLEWQWRMAVRIENRSWSTAVHDAHLMYLSHLAVNLSSNLNRLVSRIPERFEVHSFGSVESGCAVKAWKMQRI